MTRYLLLLVVTMTCGAQTPNKTFEAKRTITVDSSLPLVIPSHTGTVVRLSDAEYERLQKLRQAVADAEREIAKAHNVKLEVGCDGGYDMGHCMGTWIPSDSYEFRGQFLLISVPLPPADPGRP